MIGKYISHRTKDEPFIKRGRKAWGYLVRASAAIFGVTLQSRGALKFKMSMSIRSIQKLQTKYHGPSCHHIELSYNSYFSCCLSILDGYKTKRNARSSCLALGLVSICRGTVILLYIHSPIYTVGNSTLQVVVCIKYIRCNSTITNISIQLIIITSIIDNLLPAIPNRSYTAIGVHVLNEKKIAVRNRCLKFMLANIR